MNNELQNNLDFLIANLDNVSKNLKNKNSKKYLQQILEELQYKIKENKPKRGTSLTKKPKRGTGLPKKPKRGTGLPKKPKRGTSLTKKPKRGTSLTKKPKRGTSLTKKPKRGTGYPKKHKYKIKLYKKGTLVINDTTPNILKTISNEIKHHLHTTPTKPIVLDKHTSFSPIINKQLVSLKSIEKTDIFGNCKSFENNKLVPIVWDGVECINFDTTTAQQVLLANLSSKTVYPIENIIAPKQIQSNCWFNCMFMTFFISDKGRKFFKFFRQLMIEGKTVSGQPVPVNIWRSFGLLNLTVEATLIGYNKLEMFNTNDIIKDIYNAIPIEKRTEEIYRVNVPGNPSEYYRGIMRYLKGDNINILNIDPSFFDPENNDKTSLDMPDVICYSILSEESQTTTDLNKTLEFKVNDVLYKLDSVSIIDTDNRHFCCMITYNTKEYGFDGASFKRLNPFEWKKQINVKKLFTFKGSCWSGTTDPIYWNFKKGYQELYYYRV